MSSHFPNTDDNGGAVMTLVRLIGPEASEAEVDVVYYSDWSPKRAKRKPTLRSAISVLSQPPSVVFVRDGVEVCESSEPSGIWMNMPLAMLMAALLIYAIPTAIELFASRHISPWLSTIVAGDIAGCLCIATVFRMRLLGLLLYLFLIASKSGLYTSGLMEAEDLIWVADLVPTMFVAAMVATRPKQCTV